MLAQEINMTSNEVKIFYYLSAAGFHWNLFFARFGNYFHGGTPFQWIVFQAVALLIVMMARRLVLGAKMMEKIIILLCAVLPLISVGVALIFALQRLIR